MATWIWPGAAAPLVASSQPTISANPLPACLKIFSPMVRPASSMSRTWWLSLAQSTPAYHRF